MRLLLAVLPTLLILAYAAAVLVYTVPAPAAEAQHWPCGVASWYGSETGHTTASGAYFDGRSMTAAMPSRSHLGERYIVHYGQASVTVLVNDVGPRKDLYRIMDLSRAAAVKLGLIARGIGTVCLERIG